MLRLTFSSRQVACTRLHLLEHVLRRDVPPCRCCNLLSLRRLFEPNVFQPAAHVEPEIPAAAVQICLVSTKPLGRLLRLGGDRNQRLANVEHILSEWL
jgi:hypothetical protein